MVTRSLPPGDTSLRRRSRGSDLPTSHCGNEVTDEGDDERGVLRRVAGKDSRRRSGAGIKIDGHLRGKVPDVHIRLRNEKRHTVALENQLIRGRAELRGNTRNHEAFTCRHGRKSENALST